MEFCSVLLSGPYFFVSSIWQPPRVSFCVLGRAALTPSLSNMAYHRSALSVWMNVASLNPYLLDFHTARFSHGSG